MDLLCPHPFRKCPSGIVAPVTGSLVPSFTYFQDARLGWNRPRIRTNMALLLGVGDTL